MPQLSARRFAFISIAILWGVVAVGVGGSVMNWSDLDPAAGAWVTLAADLARDGTLYRPLVSGDGTGGTRYMPLAFVVHAALLKVGLPVLFSGMVLSFAWGAALFAGAWQLLRSMGAAREDAVVGAALAIAAGCVQSALTAMKGDLPAAALNVWALVAFVEWRDRDGENVRRCPILASALFAAAFMTKITSVFGCAAVVVTLLMRKQGRDAFRIASLTLLFSLAGVAVTQFASEGRFIETLLACGGARGSAGFFATAPARFIEQITTFDRPMVLGLFCAFAAMLVSRRYFDWRAEPLPVVLLLVTLGATVVIFGSPGTARNHLIDLHVATVVASAFALSKLPTRPVIRFGLPGGFALASAVLATALLPQTWHPYDGRAMRATLATLADVRGPILSEQPLVSLLRGERAYCLDWFAYETFTDRRAELAEPLYRDIAAKRFGAVVFLQKMTADGAVAVDPAMPVLPRLLKAYRVAARHDGYCVFLPK